MNNNSSYIQIINNLKFLKSNESLSCIDKTIDFVNTNNLIEF